MSRPAPHVVRFGVFEADPRSGELRKAGRRVAIQEQPFRILARLLQRPGELVTREELRHELWPSDTFVDFERSLNAGVKRLRDALGDDADSPRFVETIPKRGYRFIAPVNILDIPDAEASPRPMPVPGVPSESAPAETGPRTTRRLQVAALVLLALASGALLALASYFRAADPGTAAPQRVLTRLTFDSGLQTEPAWSPDGRFIAYSSDRAGNFDIWVQSVTGGEPIQVTKHGGHDWQPDWSPDGSQIVFRSEREGGGLFVIPALGGLERRLTRAGYRPRWSPDGARVLYAETGLPGLNVFIGTGVPGLAVGIEDIPTPLWVVDAAGEQPRKVLEEVIGRFAGHVTAAWHPDGRVSLGGRDRDKRWALWTAALDGRSPVKAEVAPAVEAAIADSELEVIGDAMAWSPSGDAFYVDGIVKEVRSVWRFDVDSATLRWRGGPHRLTTGPGTDTNLAISRDGTRVAFTTEARAGRLWKFPIDPSSGGPVGEGVPITSPEIDAWGPQLSSDGTKLLYQAERRGGQHRHEIWLKSLDEGREQLLRSDDVLPDGSGLRFGVHLSPDARRVSYGVVTRSAPAGGYVAIHDMGSGDERPLTEPASVGFEFAWTWTANARWLLGSGTRYTPGKFGLWLLPIASAPRADRDVRVVTASTDFTIFRAAASPADDWISFQALPRGRSMASTLFAVPLSGGEWRTLTEGPSWDGLPAWSPDGRHLYYLSSRGGLLNVWALRFDAREGRRVGDAFQVTHLENPRRRLGPSVAWAEIAVGTDGVVAPVLEVTGSVWMLDRVDR